MWTSVSKYMHVTEVHEDIFFIDKEKLFWYTIAVLFFINNIESDFSCSDVMKENSLIFH